MSAFPVPGTEVIHPEAQLSFRGPAAEDLGEIAVVGSRSGRHAGDLLAHSDGEGVSFVPAEPFTEGEEVSVTTTQDVRGVADGHFTLRVAVLGERPRLELPAVQEIGEGPDDPDEALAEDLVRQYASAPGISPPEIDVQTLDGEPGGTTFLKQHDARRAADGSITLFDNGGTCGAATRESSRGLILDVDEGRMTAELVQEYPHPDGVFAESQGSFQVLSDRDVFLGWGSVPAFTLMGPGGAVLLDARIPGDLVVTSYRAHRVRWAGHPTTDPSAVVVEDRVHVSWNGATEVAAWRLLAAAGAEVAAAPRDGFETTLPLAGRRGTDSLTVEALDDSGTVLGSAEVDGAAS